VVVVWEENQDATAVADLPYFRELRTRGLYFTQPYAAQAYDCAALALRAIEKAAREADGKVPTRPAVAQTVRTLDFHGITGNVTFNAKGDPTKARYFVIQVTTADPQRWVANRVAQTLDIAPPQ